MTHIPSPASTLSRAASGASLKFTRLYDGMSDGTTLSPNTIAYMPTTAAQPHDNRQPYLPLQYMIAVNGLWPAES